MLSKALLLLPLFHTVLAAPLAVRQRQTPSPDDDDDGIVFSPANATTVNTGSAFNFTYLTNDDDTTSVDVALIHYIRIGDDFAASGDDDRRSVSVQVSIPDDIAPGRYLIAVDEDEIDDDDDDDDDGDDLNDPSNDWSDFDLVSRTVNGTKSAYWITVTNSTSPTTRSLITRQDRIDRDDDDAVLTSPANGTVLAPGADFNFQYTCDGDCDIVRLALIRFYYVSNNTATEVRGDDRWISAQITVPTDVPADSYVLGVRERDVNDRDDNGNDDDDEDEFFDTYFDYDISFATPQSEDDGRFIVVVANGTAVAA